MVVKKLKKRLKYIGELRKSTTLEIKITKNELIKIKNKRINRKKKADKEYCEYEKNIFYGLKYIRNFFDDDTDDDIYKGMKYLFNGINEINTFLESINDLNKVYGEYFNKSNNEINTFLESINDLNKVYEEDLNQLNTEINAFCNAIKDDMNQLNEDKEDLNQ